MNKNYIIDIVKTISESKVDNKELYFFDIYKEFNESHPHLYKYACNNAEIDYKMLNYMLNKVELINNNTVTQNTASEEIGYKLYDKYIADLIPNMEKKK
jgi:hypothetical protein